MLTQYMVVMRTGLLTHHVDTVHGSGAHWSTDTMLTQYMVVVRTGLLTHHVDTVHGSGAHWSTDTPC